MTRRIATVAFATLCLMSAIAGALNAQGRGRGRQAPPSAPSASTPKSTFVGIPNPLTTPGVFTNQLHPSLRSFGYSRPYRGIYSPYIAPVSPFYSAPVYSEPVYIPSRPVQHEAELVEEVRRLSLQVDELRREQVLLPLQTQPAPQPTPAPAVQSSPSAPKVLIFKDGRRIVFHNYMLSSQALWVTDAGNSMKVPLADLNLEAMEQENRGQGLRLVRR